MLVTRSPYRPQMKSQALTVQSPAMVQLPLLLWWHLASAESTKPSGKTHHRVESQQVRQQGKEQLCREHTGNAETLSFLLSLTRLSTPTQHLAVGSSLPLEPQESSTGQTLSLLHCPAPCKGTRASQHMSALEGQHRFFLSC